MFWPTHMSGAVFVQSTPVLSGLTDGVAVIGATLTVTLTGMPATGVIEWWLDGAPIPGETGASLVVPDTPQGLISARVDGASSPEARIVESLVVGLSHPGAVLNPGDLITVTAGGSPETTGAVELIRNGLPVVLAAGQYTVTTADLGASFAARQGLLPSNQSPALTVQATPVPTLVSAPGNGGGTEPGQTRSIDMTDSWQADGATAAIVLREYRLVLDGVPGAAQSSPALVIPAGATLGQTAQPQLRARTATSALSAWEEAGPAFTISITAGGSWQISDGGNGTFSISTTPGQPAAPVITDTGAGSFDIAA